MYLVSSTISTFFNIFGYLIVAYVFMSWIPGSRESSIGRVIVSMVEPLLEPIRRMVYRSPIGGPGMIIDFSPIIALFLLNLLERQILILIYKILG